MMPPRSPGVDTATGLLRGEAEGQVGELIGVGPGPGAEPGVGQHRRQVALPQLLGGGECRGSPGADALGEFRVGQLGVRPLPGGGIGLGSVLVGHPRDSSRHRQ
ncbi:hypothetical protein SSPO_091560 [Streptomyces antimycoticus]|uniref:Uncharacterized protein n=1 Tax=Streptomyces antimycoticus TaxID=68175 RepID=A0A499V244_9ACTN|nr:hypothetical protein [Streptomyces antimycoticus]BBJ46438.1 hypothetical protein SSPO_091560 [Streptomyces antimycoticus]